jgi:D-arginine dehydrogenase
MARRAADVVVVGGGIAGISAAAALARRGLSVVVAEQEPQLAHHTTGRSAASFLESYGGRVVRALTRASRTRLAALAADDEVPALLHPRSLLWLAGDADLEELARMVEAVPHLTRLHAAEALALCPILRTEVLAGAALEADAADIDVLALHEAERRRATFAGALIRAGAPVRRGDPRGAGARRRGRGCLVRRGRRPPRRSSARPAAAAAHDRHLPLPGAGRSGVAVAQRRTAHLVQQARGAERVALTGR